MQHHITAETVLTDLVSVDTPGGVWMGSSNWIEVVRFMKPRPSPTRDGIHSGIGDIKGTSDDAVIRAFLVVSRQDCD